LHQDNVPAAQDSKFIVCFHVRLITTCIVTKD
jgi:hypothetical protein